MRNYNKLNFFTKRVFQLIFGMVFLFFFTTKTQAQVTDSISKTSKLPTPDSRLPIKRHSPKKASLMSTIIPGLGQVYNKKYWKVPLIYAGAVGLGYSFNFNNTKYLQYRNAYKVRLYNGPGTVGNYPQYSDSNLDELQKYYHRYRNLTVIGAALLYVLNIVDASVDAHLFTFDVGDDLSFNIHPTLMNTANVNHYTTGLSLNIHF